METGTEISSLSYQAGYQGQIGLVVLVCGWVRPIEFFLEWEYILVISICSDINRGCLPYINSEVVEMKGHILSIQL